ncbi:MAG: hypothetical protein LBV51_04695 [Acholeplasmatales bacterium]|jgi:collagenase-like PrtC family protease|nr:hypothetical protein [Acholeplasmatales bacterium]
MNLIINESANLDYSLFDGVIIDYLFDNDSKEVFNSKIKEYKKSVKEVFIRFRKLLTNKEIEDVKSFIYGLENFDYIICSDYGLYYALNLEYKRKFIFDSNITINNFSDYLEYENTLAYGNFISFEIDGEGILNILERKNKPVFMYGYGYLPIFFSKRNLLSNFKNNENFEINTKEDLYLVEEKRQDQKYYINEFKDNFIIRRNEKNNISNIFSFSVFSLLDYFVIDSYKLSNDELKSLVIKIKDIK